MMMLLNNFWIFKLAIDIFYSISIAIILIYAHIIFISSVLITLFIGLGYSVVFVSNRTFNEFIPILELNEFCFMLEGNYFDILYSSPFMSVRHIHFGS